MNGLLRKSRVGFVVVKLSVGGAAFFLMRLNAKWKDVNFIGGHEKLRDSGNLEKTARRELWEEVPSIRGYSDVTLEPLTQLMHYGPIRSRSNGGDVEYEIQFFLLRISYSPEVLVEMLSSRTKNIWVAEHDLLNRTRFRVSGLVDLLERSLPGGLQEIAYSSPIDLDFMRNRFMSTHGKQIELALK